MNTKHKPPSLQKYGVTRGRLPQKAGSPCMNGGGTAAAVPPTGLMTNADQQCQCTEGEWLVI